MQKSWPLCYATDVSMATILCATRWGVVLMLAFKYELDMTTRVLSYCNF